MSGGNPEKVTRNAYLNFFLQLRAENRDKPIKEVASMAGACWREMPPDEKKPYKSMAESAPFVFRRRRKRLARSRDGSIGHGGRRHRTRDHGRGHHGSGRHHSRSESRSNRRKRSS
ncbi:uncharacterized protein LOC116174485 [Photinus pyralis]|nr:uncharacterized protein LOC116174485 [Photinus pyralis]